MAAEPTHHQAAIPSVPRSVNDPITSNRANVEATLNVLVAARDAGVKRLVYAGSSSAYGDTPTLPKREDMPPGPRWVDLPSYRDALASTAVEDMAQSRQAVRARPTLRR